ncbi:hypothetical protein Golax_012286, partial [Gossypium laxum]|nr:hypothetical protein [Gossypium laxum]
AYLRELEQVNSSTETRINPREVFWRPLKEEQVKANFEAAFSQQDMTATAGVIIKNHEGFVMGAYTYLLGRTWDLTTAKANVYLQAAIFGEEIGFRDLVVEGDALIVIKKLKSDLVDRSKYQRRLNLSSSTTKEDSRIGRNRSFLSESRDATQKRLSSPPFDELRFRRNLVERFNEIFYSDEKAQPVYSTTTTIDAKKRKCDFD